MVLAPAVVLEKSEDTEVHRHRCYLEIVDDSMLSRLVQKYAVNAKDQSTAKEGIEL